MAKKRQGKHDEVMLIPFLDILCSLIGVLILIIVVLCAAQLQKAKGRSKQDVELAKKYQSLLLQQKEREKERLSLQAKLDELEKREKDLTEKQKNLEELRKQASMAADEARRKKQKVTAAQKEVAELIVQIEAISKSLTPLQSEIEKLKKLLAERKKKPDDNLASVVVRSSGSGTRRNQHLFFVETTGAGIMIHKNKTEKVRVPAASVSVDKEYNTFLKTVKGTGNSAIVFLIRRDGWGTYSLAAGWAEQAFGLNTGKLPIPGDGPVDLSLFENPRAR